MPCVSARPSAPPARRRGLGLAAALVAALATTACFSSETVIRVKADGTGTIEVQNLAQKDGLAMATGMARQATKQAGGDAAGAPNIDGIGDLFDETKLREQAASFGEGVRFVSSEPVTRDGLSGARAVFAFDDVRLINMSNRPAGQGPPTPQLRFDLQRAATPDANSTLRIRLPEGTRPAPAGADAPAAGMPRQDIPPEVLSMVRGMFKGARMSVAVEVDGAIVTTDGPQRDGSRVTIFGLDFEQMLSDPAKFAALQGMKPGTDFDTARKALEGVPGVVLPQTRTVSIEFR
jgi:hypothetical protein